MSSFMQPKKYIIILLSVIYIVYGQNFLPDFFWFSSNICRHADIFFFFLAIFKNFVYVTKK